MGSFHAIMMMGMVWMAATTGTGGGEHLHHHGGHELAGVDVATGLALVVALLAATARLVTDLGLGLSRVRAESWSRRRELATVGDGLCNIMMALGMVLAASR